MSAHLLAALLVAVAPASQNDAAAVAPATGASPALSPAGASGTSLRLVRQSQPLLGTVVEAVISVHGDEDERAAPAHAAAAFDEIRRVEALFDEQSETSSVARVNAAAGGDAVVIDPETFEVLSELQRVSRLSKGAYDVTDAAYSATWQFNASETDPPAAAERPAPKKGDVERVRAVVGWQDLVLDPAARSARLKNKGARVSLRVVLRGFALDRAAAVLEARGVRDFVLSVGGDVVVRGKKGDRPWMLGLQDPRAAGHFAALPASAGAVMTTGDYEDFFFDGGVRYHNVLDPRSGLPASKCRSVTVVAKDGITAESLSRAVFVLGAQEGVRLIDRLKGVHAVVVTSDNKVVVSKGLRSAVQYRPPTDAP